VSKLGNDDRLKKIVHFENQIDFEDPVKNKSFLKRLFLAEK